MLRKAIEKDEISKFVAFDTLKLRPMEQTKFEVNTKVLINHMPETFPFFLLYNPKHNIQEYWVNSSTDYETTKKLFKMQYLQLKR